MIKWQVIRALCEREVCTVMKERAVKFAMIKVKREVVLRALRR